MLKKLKNYYRYSKLHFYILRFKNPAYLKYLKNEFNFYRTFLLKNKLIFDLGANLGDKSDVFLKFTDKIITLGDIIEGRLISVLQKWIDTPLNTEIYNHWLSTIMTKGPKIE